MISKLLFMFLVPLFISFNLSADEVTDATAEAACAAEASGELVPGVTLDDEASMDLDATGVATLDEASSVEPQQDRRKRKQPRRNAYWYFVGCTNSNSNCSFAAHRLRFRESRTVFDVRCRSAMYACYVRRRY